MQQINQIKLFCVARKHPTEIAMSLADLVPVISTPPRPNLWRPDGQDIEMIKYQLEVHIEDTIGKGTYFYKAKPKESNPRQKQVLAAFSAPLDTQPLGNHHKSFPRREVRAINHPYIIQILGI